MKQVTRIEMANDNDLYDVSTCGELNIRETVDGNFEILLDGDVIDEACNRNEADETLLKHAIDDDIVVKGYGRYSGRKYWQLPEKIQVEIQRISK